MGDETKTKSILIRVTPAEKKMIEEKAKSVNKSVSNYLLSLSENKRIVDTTKLPRLILEINRVGVNINQIAAVANSQKYIYKELLKKIDENQREIIDLLKRILSEVYNYDEHTFKSLEHKIDKLTEKVEGLEETDGSS